jgi:hypothetical protein
MDASISFLDDDAQLRLVACTDPVVLKIEKILACWPGTVVQSCVQSCYRSIEPLTANSNTVNSFHLPDFMDGLIVS